MDGKIPEHTLHLEYSVSRQQIDELKRLVLRTNLAGMKWREWAKVATWGLVLAALMFVRADGAWSRRLIWAGGAAAF